MTGKRYLRRKRILGVSAIVLALLLIALPRLGYARNSIETHLLPGKDMRSAIEGLYDAEHNGCLTSIEWNDKALNSGTVVSVAGEQYPVYIKVSDDYSKIYIYSEADVINANADSGKMFWNVNNQEFFKNLESIDSEFMTRLNTFAVTRMDYMFTGCSSLSELDLSSFDTSSVTSMDSMFSRCSSLSELNLSSFDTSSVTSMAFMFSECSSLSELDLSSYDTSSVTTFFYMFYRCTALERIVFGSGFNTDNAISLVGMFRDCSSLVDLDTKVLTRVTPNYENGLNSLFGGCSSLEQIDIRGLVRTEGNNGYVADILTGCTSLNWIGVSKSLGYGIQLPYDDFVVDNGDGTYGETTYSEIPFFDEASQAYIRRSVIPTPTAEATQAAVASPTAEVSPTAGVTQSAGITPTPTATPSPVVTVSPIPTPTSIPTPTPTPTQAPTKSTLVIVDNRADQANTDKITATVSNLVGSLKLIINDDDGADIKKIQPLKKGQVLIPYDIYLIDNSGNRYTNFGSCTITLPIPDSLDLTKGTLAVVAAKSSNVLENVSNTKLVKNNVNCVQFTATHFSEYGLLWTPYTELTGAVTPSVTPATTPTTTQAAAKATSSAGGSGSGSGSSGSKSGSSSSSSSSGTTNGNGKAVPVSGVKGYSNAKDMPKTGDGDVYRILGAIILFLFGSIELVSSVKVKSAE